MQHNTPTPTHPAEVTSPKDSCGEVLHLQQYPSEPDKIYMHMSDPTGAFVTPQFLADYLARYYPGTQGVPNPYRGVVHGDKLLYTHTGNERQFAGIATGPADSEGFIPYTHADTGHGTTRHHLSHTDNLQHSDLTPCC